MHWPSSAEPYEPSSSWSTVPSTGPTQDELDNPESDRASTALAIGATQLAAARPSNLNRYIASNGLDEIAPGIKEAQVPLESRPLVAGANRFSGTLAAVISTEDVDTLPRLMGPRSMVEAAEMLFDAEGLGRRLRCYSSPLGAGGGQPARRTRPAAEPDPGPTHTRLIVTQNN